MESNNLPDIIVELLKNLREEKNFNQEYLARKLGISQRAYSKIEKKEIKLTLDNLVKLSKVLNFDIRLELLRDDPVGFNNGQILNGGNSKPPQNEIIKVKNEQIDLLKNQIDLLTAIINKLLTD